MTRVNPNIGNESKADIFPWDMLKSDIIPFLFKKY